MNYARQRQNVIILFLCGIIVLSVFSGCVKHTEGYQSVNLSADIPVNTGSEKTPVIVIHGLFGAELFSVDGKNVWGKFSNRRIMDEKLLKQLAFDELKVDSIMSYAEVTPGNIPVLKLKNYILLLNALKTFGYTEKNLFIFAYDWRKSVPENAAELHNFVCEKAKLFPEKQKFNIIAHSMGGLISRYYLQYGTNKLQKRRRPRLSDIGARKISKVFIFGTPNCGYVDTVTELIGGLSFVRGAAQYPTWLLGNFKSYFCMMPHNSQKAFIYSDDGSVVDIYDIEVWKKLKWGLASDKKIELFPSRESALKILENNLEIGRQFVTAMQQPMKRRAGLKFYLFAGNSFDTAAQCSVNRKDGSIKVVKYAPGDGKILFDSAYGDDLVPWDGVYLFGASHMGLFNSNDAMRNLCFLLQEKH